MPKKKKKYEKPEVTRIRLDAKCAVLSFCKSANVTGPGIPGDSGGCTFNNCNSIGS